MRLRSLSVFSALLLLSSLALAQRGGQAPAPGPQQTAPSSQQQQPGNTTAPADPTAPSVPGLAAPVDPNSYLIGTGDILMIRVWREPELSGPVAVRPDGMFTLPLVGEIKASGLTPEGLKKSLTEALNNYITKPEVMVSVAQVLSKKYYISGEAGRTGPFPLVVPTTILEALSTAGFREFANKKKIIIMRGKDRLKFNYNDVVKGKNMEQNILLQDGDHIIVP